MQRKIILFTALFSSAMLINEGKCSLIDDTVYDDFIYYNSMRMNKDHTEIYNQSINSNQQNIGVNFQSIPPTLPMLQEEDEEEDEEYQYEEKQSELEEPEYIPQNESAKKSKYAKKTAKKSKYAKKTAKKSEYTKRQEKKKTPLKKN